VDMLLCSDVSTEFCCKMIDMYGPDSARSSGRLIEKCNEILDSMKPKQNYDSVFIYV